MKRLGVYAFIATILVVGMGGFFSQEKVFAAAFDTPKAALINAFTQATFVNNYTPAQKTEYKQDVSTLKGIISDHLSREDPSIGDMAFAMRVLGDLQTYLAGKANVQTDPAMKQVTADADALRATLQKDFSAAGTDQATLTALEGGAGPVVDAQQSQENAKKELAAVQANGAAATSGGTCSLTLNFKLSSCIDDLVTFIIKNTLLQLAGFLVWLTANMLNFAIQISILDFSKWAPSSLYPIWIIIRQIVSLVVVFAGLYLGFMYIIGREDTFGKYVGWLVIFAIFVNFSYPVTRALTDVSNIISLNVYASAVGNAPIEGSGTATAGGLIMDRLGLNGLVASATASKTSFIGSIDSTPGALLAVAFVLYAAYVFFMATAIIATRTAVLVFLIVASPLLLVDSVIPKLGEVAMKMRKMFFEQLVVAPLFMIMLALTLKFMEVFQSPAVNGQPAGPLAGTISSSAIASSNSIQTFFGILMMLIMLHIMLKVTKSMAGEAGNYATNMMGKVGGFGLGLAAGGTGLLARGTVGQMALGARDSKWMDGMKDSKIGRGLYGLSNSLAQSTFDTRNIGMVSAGMKSAGLTGGFGMSMQQGSKKGFETERKEREDKVLQFGSNIRDDKTRASYFGKANNGFVYSKVDDAKLRLAQSETQQKKDAQLATLMSTTDPEKRKNLIDQALASKDNAMADKLRAGDSYLGVDNTKPDAAKEKAELLKKMGLTDEKAKDLINKQDPFADLQKAHDATIKNMDLKLGTMLRNTDEEKKAYDVARTEIGKVKAAHEEQVKGLREATLSAYNGSGASPTTEGAPDQNSTQSAQSVSTPHPGGSDMSQVGPKTPSGPGGSNTAQYEAPEYNIPTYQRNRTSNEGRELSETELNQIKGAFASSFAENMRKGRGQAGTAVASTPTPKTPSPTAVAA